MILKIEIFIGDIKEDQVNVNYDLTNIETLREIKRKYTKQVSEKIRTGEWREPKFAGEFNVSLKIISNELKQKDLEVLEYQANTIY